MPPINLESEPPTSPGSPEPRPARKDSGPELELRGITLSPSAGVVKSIFPTSKSRSLKKKNSILAKRRCIPMRTLLASGGAGAGAGAGVRAGVAWQRVRASHAQQPRWARRHLLLAHRALYAYRTTECSKADCMINLEGFTVSAASEVKSRAHAFKVYHTGTAFYFAAASSADMAAWITAVAAATLHAHAHAQQPLDISQQFSETDYSDTESDSESCERRERERREERERDRERSKFGSLKKLTGRMQRSESTENVGHSTSLDRKYLRFFSRNKSKDDSKPIKIKQPVPVPTEQYRSYRRAAPAHASSPELASPRAPRPAPPPPPRPRPAQLTLEEFMLAEQEDTKRQMYTDRVVLGVQASELQRRLDGIAADAAHHQPPATNTQSRNTTQSERRPRASPANNGVDKPSYPEEQSGPESADAGPHERWRDSLRRNHKVHSAQTKPVTPVVPSGTSWSGGAGSGVGAGAGGGVGAGAGGGVSRLRLVFGAAPQYPHLQCPPTFQPESYSLARLAPSRAPPPPPS